MYSSGDAAEQVVRMSLEGAEFALKISGSAAKNLAAALYTVLKDQKKTKGKARIETMLREKRPMTVYTIKKEDAPEFARQAKGYGILYAPIPVKRMTTPSTFWYSRMMRPEPIGSWRSSTSPWWIRRPSRRTSRNPANSAAANRQRRNRPPRKRARTINYWTN